MSAECHENSSNEDVIQITIHYCDNLKAKILLLQPVICMHVIDEKTGTYLKKSDRSRAVVSFYENQRNDVDYIIPVMTQPCSIAGEKLLSWEEVFILNEEYSAFFNGESHVILFFEIVDLTPIHHSKNHYERLNQNGMHKIAWAFLKLIGSNGAVNSGSKLRLQLFKPSKSIKQKKVLEVEVYKWWLKKTRIPIEASLFISIEPRTVFTAEPALRSMSPFQPEKGSTTFDRLSESSKESALPLPQQCKSSSVLNEDIEIIWSRKKGEPCKIPKKKLLLLNIYSSCQIIKFSTHGRILAAGCGSLDSYYLMFYQIPNGKLLHKALAHSELIYDLDWSLNDRYFLSASGDYSVKMWDVKCWRLKEAFVHPSYVYSAKFHPKCENIFVSSCYDNLIRIWTLEKCQLLKELEAHNSTVCAICWDVSGTKLYSADGMGQIKVWGNLKQVRKDTIHVENFQLECEINPVEIKGIAVNKICLDSEGKTLCLFCHDSVVRILCLESGCILCSYESDISLSKLSKGCSSPCGGLLFLSCDKGSVYVWNRNDLSDVKMDPELLYDLNYGSVSCIEYHPYEHMLALSFWEEGVPVHIYASHDKVGQEKKDFHYDALDMNIYKKIDKLKLTSKVDKCVSLESAARNSGKSKYKKHNQAKYRASESEEASFSADSNGMYTSKMQGRSSKESLTAVVTKSGQFAIISTPDDSTSDSNTFRDLSKEPTILNRSSKRCQRRQKLREMNRALP